LHDRINFQHVSSFQEVLHVLWRKLVTKPRLKSKNDAFMKILCGEKDNLTLFPSPRQNDMIQIASIALLKAASLLP